MKKESLTTGNIYQALVKFAVPFLMANLLQVFYGTTDLLVVGRFASTADVSAVSIGSQIMATLTNFILGLSMGATILLGHSFGARRERDMAKTVGTSVWMFGIIAIVITILILCLLDPIVAIMNTPQEAVPATFQYLLMCACGLPFIVGYNVVSAILRGLGDSKTPLLFVAVACIINVILDIVLVGIFSIGAVGAAIATVIAQAASVIFSLFFLRKRGIGFAITLQDFRFFPDFAAKMLKTGAPVGLQNALVGISFLIITLVINKMGLVASAAVGVSEKLIEFLMLPSIAFGSAVSAMSAQNFGAGELRRAKQCMKAGILFSLAFGILVTIFCQFRGDLLTGLFTAETDVIQSAAQYLKTYSIDCLMVAFVFNMNGYFNGAGYAAFSMLHSLAATFAVRIPGTIFLSHLPGVTLEMMGCASPLSTFVSLILCLFFFLWLKKHPEKLEDRFSGQ